jgi:hypothetical protein
VSVLLQDVEAWMKEEHPGDYALHMILGQQLSAHLNKLNKLRLDSMMISTS